MSRRRVWWNPPRAPDPKSIHVHELVRPYLQTTTTASTITTTTTTSRSLSQSLLHASHHTDQLVDHQLELFTAPLHPGDLITHPFEHVVHLGLFVVFFLVLDTHVYVPFMEVKTSRDLTGTDALAEC